MSNGAETPAPQSPSDRLLWREISTLRTDLRDLERTQQQMARTDERFAEQLHRVIEDVIRVEAAARDRDQEITEELKLHVTLDRYKPTELIVFSIVAIVGAAFLTALAALVFKAVPPH